MVEFRIEEYSPGNAVLYKGKIDVFYGVCDNSHGLRENGNGCEDKHLKPIPLTKEILKNNLGFEVHDMGDYWQCEKEDFVLIQIKLAFGDMPYMFVLKSSIKESVNFYYVHHLQNTYLNLKGELLKWQS